MSDQRVMYLVCEIDYDVCNHDFVTFDRAVAEQFIAAGAKAQLGMERHMYEVEVRGPLTDGS